MPISQTRKLRLRKVQRLGKSCIIKKYSCREFPAVQWVRLGAFTAVGLGSVPGGGIKIPQAVQRSQKKKRNTADFQNRRLPVSLSVTCSSEQSCPLSFKSQGMVSVGLRDGSRWGAAQEQELGLAWNGGVQ